MPLCYEETKEASTLGTGRKDRRKDCRCVMKEGRKRDTKDSALGYRKDQVTGVAVSEGTKDTPALGTRL